ncbi:MAG: VWA domain-containing protein [Phycisphaerales bacterium]
MTFLSPIAGLIAAGLALPAVVALYFLKLRRRPLRVSSTLLWERALLDLEVNVPFRWLRLSWPLVLQVLAAALLAGAIGRPTVRNLGGAGDAGRVLVLIDRSASMSALDGPAGADALPTSRLDEARRAAGALIEGFRRAGESPEVTVAAFAARAVVQAAPTSNLRLARESLDAIRPSDQAARLDAAADLLTAFAGDAASHPDAPPAVVHVFTDGCNDPLDHPLVIPGLSIITHRVAPAPATDPPRAPNSGIVALSARRDYDDPATVRLLVRILADDPASPRSALQVLLDGVPIGSASIETRPAPGLPGASEATSTFALPITRGGVLTAMLPSGDPLRADDAASLVLSPPVAARVVVIGPGSPDDRDAGVNPLIRSCLRAMNLDRVEFLTRADAEARYSTPGAARPDLFIFDRVRPPGLLPVPSITFGAPLPIPGLRIEPAPQPGPTRIVSWRRTHPLLRGVPLEAVVADEPSIIALDANAAGGAPPGFEPLAEGFDGPLFALVEHLGVRRIVIGFDLGKSNWGPTASFPVFLAGAVDFLTLRAEGQSGRALTTSDPLTLRPAPGSTRVIARAIGIDDAVLAAPVLPDAPTVLGFPERAAVYRCEGTVPEDSIAAVNLLAPPESLLTLDPQVLQRDPLAAFPIAGAPGAGERPSLEPARGEVWHYFVALALLLLTLEWFLVAWRMRVPTPAM